MKLNFLRKYQKCILIFGFVFAISISKANDIENPVNFNEQGSYRVPLKSKFSLLLIDSDGDGLMDDEEIANGSDPNNACDPPQKPGYALFDVNNPIWRQSDCDGDGIDNITEFSDNNPQTDPYCSGNLSTGGGNFLDTFNVENAENADGLPDGIFTGDLSPNIETITLAYPNLKVGDRICIVLGFSETDGVLAWQLNGSSGEVVNPTSNISYEAQEICLTVVEAGNQELILNENGPGAIRIDGSTYFSCEQAIDTDGDGILDIVETSNGSDPNNSCDPAQPAGYVDFDSDNDLWKNSDCDDDGVANFDEFLNGTDPYSISADTDGDGIADDNEIAQGTDPNEPCEPIQDPSYTLFDGTNPIWRASDCDDDGVLNGDEFDNGTNPYAASGDTDGDGINDTIEISNGSDPNNPCDPEQTRGYTGFDPENELWRNSDCDGDGVGNIDEFVNGTDPYFASEDSDGDGLSNDIEEQNGTDPNNPCDPNQDETYLGFNGANPIWSSGDCDEDGVSNGSELQNGTNPYLGSVDTDGDGILDDVEIDIGSDIDDPCDPAQESGYSAFDDTNDMWLGADCDGDGFLNTEELEAGTDPYTFDVNDNTTDTDGDGISDNQEAVDGTDPNNSCDSIGGTPSATDDCDDDGLTNAEEAIGIDDPSTPADPNGQITDPDDADTDDDTISDGQETLDGTDPNDACDSVGGIPPQNFDCGALSIASDLITPNTNNGIFRINNIERFGENTVSVFNRWGVKVFEEQGYDNRNVVFNGFSNARATIQSSKALPVGVYFYVIKYVDKGNTETLQGYLYLNR